MKALVLSSGGVDSTTCVALAVKDLGKENVSTLSVYYGQRHRKELESADRIAKYYGLKHYELDLSEVMKYSDSSLLEHSGRDIPLSSYAEQMGRSADGAGSMNVNENANGNGRISTYVPFRNGLMLSTAASLAQSIYPDEEVYLYYGAHADDAAGDAYPDCSKEFINAIGSAINIGTYKLVTLKTPFAGVSKAEVVKTGLELKVPYELTWSCYSGGERPCRKCATCIDRERAFEINGVKDPLLCIL